MDKKTADGHQHQNDETDDSDGDDMVGGIQYLLRILKQKNPLQSNENQNKCIRNCSLNYIHENMTANFKIIRRLLSLPGCQTTSYLVLTHIKQSTCSFFG